MSTVIEARRIDPAPRNIGHDEHARDAYLGAIDAALASALREVREALLAPRRANPDRASRVLGHFVDTIEGFALGVIASHLTSGLRRWYGDDGLAAMRGALQGWPSNRRVVTEGTAAEQLYVRFCHVNIEARSLVASVPDRPMTAVMLSLLAKEDTVQRRLADAITLGWRVYSAAVTTRRYPPLDRLWQAWVWALEGKPVLTRDENEQAGYITLVR